LSSPLKYSPHPASRNFNLPSGRLARLLLKGVEDDEAPLGPRVAPIVQLHGQRGLHAARIADQEVDVLPVDAVHPAPVTPVVARRGEEQLAEGYLGADGGLVADDGLENVVEADFGRGEEVLPPVIGEGRLFLSPGRQVQPAEENS
jgi:hypothetical protein